MREYARAVLEDKESANEELRSANEELQSTNEELQSVNEELETASEEVQSANEELRTLNEELHAVNNQLAKLNEELTAKNEELREVNAALDTREIELRSARDYALAVIDTVREPLVILDPDFRVVSASPPFYGMFKTSATPRLGESFFELDEGHWDIAELREATETGTGRRSGLSGFRRRPRPASARPAHDAPLRSPHPLREGRTRERSPGDRRHHRARASRGSERRSRPDKPHDDLDRRLR